MSRRYLLFLGVMTVILQGLAFGEDKAPSGRPYIPYMATPHEIVRDMLFMADVGKDDMVYDLGSGDGRIVIAAVRDFGCRRAVGIEIDPKLIGASRENAQKAGVLDGVEFVEQDLFLSDFQKATVVTLFLGHEANIKLRPKLLATLKPGTRIVSNEFGMGEWPWDKELRVRKVYLGMYGFGTLMPWGTTNPHVPDYSYNENMFFNGVSKVFMWVVPAPVAGVWRGETKTEKGEQELKLTLFQGLSGTTGSFELCGVETISGYVKTDLWGNHLRFECIAGDSSSCLIFDGLANGDSLQGTVAGSMVQQQAWELRRDNADFLGTWEWDWATRSRTAKIDIKQGDGGLLCSYSDGVESKPVVDFYNFGGGFYFTALLANGGGGQKPADTGWLIGEAVLDGSALKGTIAYHLTAEMNQQPPVQYPDSREDWVPKRIAP